MSDWIINKLSSLVIKVLGLDRLCAKCNHYKGAHIRDHWWAEDFCRACPDYAIGHPFKEKERRTC